MKKNIVCILVLLFLPQLLIGQTTQTGKSGEAEGARLGNIIKGVIDIALPGITPLIDRLFPKKDSISKKDFDAEMNKIQEEMKRKINSQLAQISAIVAEIEALSKFLNPCIQIQDYLREVNVLVERAPISDADWKRVKDIWVNIETKVKNIKSVDLAPIREDAIKLDLSRMQGVDVTMERIRLDFIDKSTTIINSDNRLLIFAIQVRELITLYQTVQMVLDLSLKRFKADFNGAVNAMSGRPSIAISLMDDETQLKIKQRLDSILIK